MKPAPTIPEGTPAPLVPGDDFEAKRMRGHVARRLFDDVDAVSRFGRYEVLERLGRGGLGVVYRGSDPQLGRDVALKVMRTRTARVSAGRDQRRVLREARNQARLTHPNVVAIYDVGVIAGKVYIAMELVEGTTLGTWVEQPGRSWRDIVRMYLQAARGLAAAHDAGIAHRDFKPGNVMVGRDGRARVLDFGLAKVIDPTETGSDWAASNSADSEQPPRMPESPTIEGPMTESHGWAGTPAYMAPEQFGNGDVGPSSDQFSFCVALFEALYGERPFRGETPADLVRAIADDEITNPDPERPVPGEVRSILRRGLQASPPARWPSMDALVRPLEDLLGRRRRRRRRWAFAASSVAIIAAAGVLMPSDATEQPCGDPPPLFTDDARRDIADAFHRAAADEGSEVWVHLQPRLRSYSEQWSAAYDHACLVGGVELDPSMQCLARARESFATLQRALVETESSSVRRSLQAALGLPDVGRCTDPVALREDAAAPPSQLDAPRVNDTRTRLVRVGVLLRTGQLDEAASVAERSVTDAEEIGFGPLVAEALDALAKARQQQGRYEEAAVLYRDAYETAAAHRRDRVAAHAATQYMYIRADRLRDFNEADAWTRTADAAVKRAEDPLLSAGYMRALGALRYVQGDLEGALSMHERALDILETTEVSKDEDLALTHLNLAMALRSLGRLDEAEPHFQTSLAEQERLFGPFHPDLGSTLLNLADVYHARGEFERAEELQRRSLELLETALGSRHPLVGSAVNNLAGTLSELGRSEESQRLHRRAISVWEEALGPEHTHVAIARVNLSLQLSGDGRYDEAIQIISAAVEALERNGDRQYLPAVHENLATVQYQAGEFDAARAHLERALELSEETGRERPISVTILVMLGTIASEQGRSAEAERWTTRVLPLHDRSVELGTTSRGWTLYSLARLVHSTGVESHRAELLARQALAAHRKAGSADAAAEVEQWLAEIG